MKKAAIVFLFIFSFTLKSYEQTNIEPSYINRAEKLLLAISRDSLSLIFTAFGERIMILGNHSIL